MESSSFPGPSKRAKALGNIAQVARCLVDGCSADLSLCRDYHRRHKVCEVHSKTPKVTIGGQEQRFCQQCSRFQSVVEFDEGKRSCRKRLDGHNRRRRKPQLHSRSSSSSGTPTPTTGSCSASVRYNQQHLQLQLNYMDPAPPPSYSFEFPGIQTMSSHSHSDAALSLLSSSTHFDLPQTNLLNNNNTLSEVLSLYHQTKALHSSPPTTASTFHFPEAFHQDSSTNDQTLSFIWD